MASSLCRSGISSGCGIAEDGTPASGLMVCLLVGEDSGGEGSPQGPRSRPPRRENQLVLLFARELRVFVGEITQVQVDAGGPAIRADVEPVPLGGVFAGEQDGE